MTEQLGKAVKDAADLCRKFEGLKLSPYLCPAGYPTVGYGTVWKPSGTRVTLDDPAITKATAELWLFNTLERTCLPGVLKASPMLAAYPDALAAMLDFAYNLGVGRYRSSTLRLRINEQDWDGAKEQLMRWVRGGGKILPGLVRRRFAEMEMF